MARFKTQPTARLGKSSNSATSARSFRPYSLSQLDRAAVVLAVIAAFLFVCVVVVMARRPAKKPTSSVVATAAAIHDGPTHSPPLQPAQSTELAAPSPRETAEQRAGSRSATQVSQPVVQIDRATAEPELRNAAKPAGAGNETPQAAEEPVNDSDFGERIPARRVETEPSKPVADARPPLRDRKPPLVVEKPDPDVRQWTYASGESFQGKFLRFRDNKVIIQSADSVLELHPSQLSQEDRSWYTSLLRSKREAEGEKWRARIARARRTPRAPSRRQVVPAAGHASGFNPWNNGWAVGFQNPNYLPLGYGNYPNGSAYYPAYFRGFGGFGGGGPQYIRRHIYIAPGSEPQNQRQNRRQRRQQQ